MAVRPSSSGEPERSSQDAFHHADTGRRGSCLVGVKLDWPTALRERPKGQLAWRAWRRPRRSVQRLPRRSNGVAWDSAAFSYQELDLRSVRFQELRLFFAAGFLRGLLGAFERAGALRFGMANPSCTNKSIGIPQMTLLPNLYSSKNCIPAQIVAIFWNCLEPQTPPVGFTFDA